MRNTRPWPLTKGRRPPANLSLAEAGAIPTTGRTAIQGVGDVLQVARGEAVVIHGAAGGVGSLALRFAKTRGARVLATASGRDGIAFVRELGADASVDGRRDDLVAAALGFAPGGVDAVLAFPGGKPLTPARPKRRGISVQSYDAPAHSAAVNVVGYLPSSKLFCIIKIRQETAAESVEGVASHGQLRFAAWLDNGNDTRHAKATCRPSNLQQLRRT